ncbi:MAG: AraC family transcriptional regulator [Bacteroidota bacterium]
MERPPILEFDFLRETYGPELLIDVGRVGRLDGYVLDPRPHRLSFYDVLLIDDGEGSFALDGQPFLLEPGRVVFTSPGQVRVWRTDGVRASTLFFDGEFVEAFFADALFLHKLQYFHTTSPPPTVVLDLAEAAWLRATLAEIEREVAAVAAAGAGDAEHALRALLYLVLVRLHRAYAAAHGTAPDTEAHPVVSRFRRLVEDHFARERSVGFYGRALGLSPRRLTEVVQPVLGVPPGEYVRRRTYVEARRLVQFSSWTFAEIAAALGFEDAAYFSRFFRRYAKRSPSEIRPSAEKYQGFPAR